MAARIDGMNSTLLQMQKAEKKLRKTLAEKAALGALETRVAEVEQAQSRTKSIGGDSSDFAHRKWLPHLVDRADLPKFDGPAYRSWAAHGSHNGSSPRISPSTGSARPR